jgi:hypothetical protein
MPTKSAEHTAIEEKSANGTVTFFGAGSRAEVEAEKGQEFPSVDEFAAGYKVVNGGNVAAEDSDKAVSIWVNPQFVAELVAAMPTTHDCKGVKLTIPFHRGKPIRLDSGRGFELGAKAILMPVNGEPDDEGAA